MNGSPLVWAATTIAQIRAENGRASRASLWVVYRAKPAYGGRRGALSESVPSRVTLLSARSTEQRMRVRSSAMARGKRAEGSKHDGSGGDARAAHMALLARYAALDPNQLPPGAQFIVLKTDSEELALISFPEPQLSEVDHPSGPELTPAEASILRHLRLGHSNAAIAHARKRSVRTVGHQIASVFRKLGVSSRRELLAVMRREEATPTAVRKPAQPARDP